MEARPNDIYTGQTILRDGSSSLLAAYTYSKLSPDDVLSMTVTTAGAALGMAPGAGTFYFLKDAIGSITDIIDGAGNILQRMEYSSFGKMLKVTNSVGTDTTSNPGFDLSYTYTGREPDKETGLMYYRARYYDPSIGRFLQEDPHPGRLADPITTINKYQYTGNSPTNRVDPSGRDFWDVIIGIAVITAVVFTGGAAAAFIGAALGSAVGGGIAGAIIGATTGVIAGALIGGVVGAGIGALSYTWLGRDATLGARTYGTLGAVVGGIAGGIAGGFGGYTKHAAGFADYASTQYDLAKSDPVGYFLDLTYDKSPIGATLFGGGFGGPSLGGTGLLISTTLFLGDPTPRGRRE